MNPLFAFRFEIARRASTYDVLMVFAATPTLDREAFATVVEAEIEANLVPDELLIVVRGPSFAATLDELKADSLHKATLARLRNRSTVTLIGYDCLGDECQRAKVDGPEPRRKVQFDDFKRRAMTSIFNTRHGFVESTSTYHFENPSGRHTERFIRLSNVLARGAEIAFIGFCALPYVPKKVSTAYLDTPSLYAVVAAINEQRSSFAGDADPILADNFSSYAGFDEYRFERVAEALVIISASSSGTLARRLIDEKAFEPERITHLLFLGKDKSGAHIVCDLAQHARDNPEGITTPPAVEEPKTCRMCASGSHAIKLQGDQFEFAGPQQDALLIAKNHAPPGLLELMGRYAGQAIFEIGLGRNTSRTPRQLNINPENLLASTGFRERLDYVLRRSLPASLSHVIALDRGSAPLAQYVVENGGSATVIKRDALDAIPADTQSAIVVAAAVIESGRSLLDISRDLRSIAPKAPILYLVGVSKTTGEPRRESLDRNLIQTYHHFPYQVILVERIALPVSTEANAWAAELKLLIDPHISSLAPIPVRRVIDARVARLRRASEALNDELFIPNAGRPLKLQPGFVFWPDGLPDQPHTQADVFFTICSVLQQLRANAHRFGKPAIKSNWFQQTILAPGNFGRFNDDIIQASILRAAYPFEMNFTDTPEDSRELGRLVRRIIESCRHDRGGAATEFLLALATDRLQLCVSDLTAVLEADSSGVPMVQFMQAVCRQKFSIA